MSLGQEKRFFAALRMTRGVGAQNDKGAVIRRRGSPLSVILRSFAPKNLSGHAPETGGKILRFAQNDNRGGARNDKGAVILRGGFPPLVILRSFAPKNLSGHVSGTGEKILRFAQNDKGAVIRRRALPPPLSF